MRQFLLNALLFGLICLGFGCNKAESLQTETHTINWYQSEQFTQSGFKVLFRYADDQRCACVSDCDLPNECFTTVIITDSIGKETQTVLSSKTDGTKPNKVTIDGAEILLDRVGPIDLCKQYQQYAEYQIQVSITK